MATIVKMDPEGGPVTVEIDISTNLPWSYTYAHEHGSPFSSKSTEADPMPHVYPLGEPDDLDGDYNTWVIAIDAVSAGESYEVVIRWVQDGEELNRWTRSGEVNEDSPAVIELSGTAKFMLK